MPTNKSGQMKTLDLMVNSAMIGIEGRIPRKGSPAGVEISAPTVAESRMAPILNHHNRNVRKGKTVLNIEDGSESSVKTSSWSTTPNVKGPTMIVPTIWNGKELKGRKGLVAARASGIAWPEFSTQKEADAADVELHKHWSNSYNKGSK